MKKGILFPVFVLLCTVLCFSAFADVMPPIDRTYTVKVGDRAVDSYSLWWDVDADGYTASKTGTVEAGSVLTIYEELEAGGLQYGMYAQSITIGEDGSRIRKYSCVLLRDVQAQSVNSDKFVTTSKMQEQYWAGSAVTEEAATTTKPTTTKPTTTKPTLSATNAGTAKTDITLSSAQPTQSTTGTALPQMTSAQQTTKEAEKPATVPQTAEETATQAPDETAPSQTQTETTAETQTDAPTTTEAETTDTGAAPVQQTRSAGQVIGVCIAAAAVLALTAAVTLLYIRRKRAK